LQSFKISSPSNRKVLQELSWHKVKEHCMHHQLMALLPRRRWGTIDLNRLTLKLTHQVDPRQISIPFPYHSSLIDDEVWDIHISQVKNLQQHPSSTVELIQKYKELKQKKFQLVNFCTVLKFLCDHDSHSHFFFSISQLCQKRIMDYWKM
jgi:hypothetical protein